MPVFGIHGSSSMKCVVVIAPLEAVEKPNQELNCIKLPCFSNFALYGGDWRDWGQECNHK